MVNPQYHEVYPRDIVPCKVIGELHYHRPFVEHIFEVLLVRIDYSLDVWH